MPFENEHACRIKEPDGFEDDSFRRVSRDDDGKEFSAIMGRLQGEESLTEQSFRYPIENWSEEEARGHCTGHNGILFEPATGSVDDPGEPVSDEEMDRLTKLPGLERRIYGKSVNWENRGDHSTISGYGAVFHSDDPGTEFSLWADTVEWIERSAFDRVISEKQDVFGFFNHDHHSILGRTSSGTMRLNVDDVGLHYEIDLPNTQIGKDVSESIKRGDLTGSSIGFMVGSESWHSEGDKVIRRILDVDVLIDTGPVTFPAYKATSAISRTNISEARESFIRWKSDREEVRHILDIDSCHRDKSIQLAEKGIKFHHE